jgi:hypothetical protein
MDDKIGAAVSRKQALNFNLLALVLATSSVSADVTYTLDESAQNQAQVVASMAEAVALYNKYGSFNKHLSVTYSPSIPTAMANGSGWIGFGGQRGTRAAMHEMSHTLGVGTAWQYRSLMAGGTYHVWDGFYGKKKAIENGSEFEDGLHGSEVHMWPWGLNYSKTDSPIERIKHVQILAALRCDMGKLGFTKEAEHQVVPLGGTAMISVASATTDGYQWYKDGNPLSNGGDVSGADTPTLQIANMSEQDVGDYYCLLTRGDDTMDSRSRRLILEEQVGQWDFENSSNASVGDYDGVTSGSPSYSSGMIGQAIDLDGADDYITLPEGVADAKDITVSAWVNWNGGDQSQRIFDFGTSTMEYLCMEPRSGDDTMRFSIKNDKNVKQYVETSQLPIGEWVHVAVTLRGDTGTLYINGQAVDSNDSMTYNPIDFAPTNNYIGKSQFDHDPYFNGSIDDFRVYNYPLSGSEIWSIWGQSSNNPPVFDTASLTFSEATEEMLYAGESLSSITSDPENDTLTFSKVSGPAWLEVTSNGALSGTPGADDRGVNTFIVRVTDTSGATDDAAITITVYGPADARYEFAGSPEDSVALSDGVASGDPTYRAGILGDAISLDGIDDYVTLPIGVADAKDITITSWVRWNGGENWQRIFDFGNDTAKYMALSPNTETNTFDFVMTGTGGGRNEQKLSGGRLAIGEWVHVAITIGGDIGKLYVNGELVDTHGAMIINPSDFRPTVNYIGKSQYDESPLFNGDLDDFHIYHYALSSSEIGEVMGGGRAYTLADSDGDGVPDTRDLYPSDPNEWADYDGDEVPDNADTFPYDSKETVDSDGDGVGDNGDAFPNDPSESADSDGDGVGDNADAYPNDKNETMDTDGDGIGDNADTTPNGEGSPAIDAIKCADEGSDCTIPEGAIATVWFGANSHWYSHAFVTDRISCSATAFGDPATGATKSCYYIADRDHDEVSDDNDVFPDDPTESIDSDEDGVGDNSDAFPHDPSESSDTDGDGIGNNADATPNGEGQLPSGAIKCADERKVCTLPEGITTTVWYGAEQSWHSHVGVSGSIDCNNDVFVDPIKKASKACYYIDPVDPPVGGVAPDSDGDGVVDSVDAFPNDPSETRDTDGDGVGDNTDVFPNDPSESADSDGDGVGNNADAFPNDSSETVDSDGDGIGDNSDVFPNTPDEIVDTDGDGVGDNADAFPSDPTESIDSDGDGVGNNSDAFPKDPSETLDSDGDGVGDNSDAFPNDPSKTTDSDGDDSDDSPEPTSDVVSGLPSSNAVKCSDERKTCTLPEGVTATVWYGARNTWFARTAMIGKFHCGNRIFGDPLRGVRKACYYIADMDGDSVSDDADASPNGEGQPPSGVELCSGERAICALPEGRSATVWYGADNSWYSRNEVSGNIECSNTVFGDH